MISTQIYEELFKKILENYSKNSLKVEKNLLPQNSPAECLRNKISYYAYAVVSYKTQSITLQFLYPTERGNIIINGYEMSPSFQAINVSEKKHPANSELSQFLIYPAPLLSLKKRLESIFIRNHSEFEADYLEGLLNQTTFPKLSAYEDINLLSEAALQRKITLEGGENMPASARFLDDTHFKKLCPLETPESTEIGLRLFVARNARLSIENELPATDKNETGIKIIKSDTEDFLGYSSWIVPFLHHNDGARAMMGGKNIKQAVPLIRSETPLIKTGIEKELADKSNRLIRSLTEGTVEEITTKKIVIRNEKESKEYSLLEEYPSNSNTLLGHISLVKEGQQVKKGDLLADWSGTLGGEAVFGTNVLVGYLPFYGLNIEDGIAVSRSLAEKFTSRHLYKYKFELNEGEEFVDGDRISKGSIVFYGDVLAAKRFSNNKNLSANKKLNGKSNKENKTLLKFDKRSAGKIIDVKEDNNSRIVVLIEAERPLEVGDKLTGRHGNKGVVALILEDAEMPYFKLDGNNYPVEMLLNPAGVVSRMNLGQLLETHYSWLVKNNKIEANIGKPFREIDLDKLKDHLKEIGLPEGKAEVFLDKENSQTDSRASYIEISQEAKSLGKVVVGYQYFAKLNHLAGDKFHVRTSGSRYSTITRQPVKGKRFGGGQRIGEMEVWSLLGHSAFNILHEFLTVKSDDITVRENLIARFNSELKLPQNFTAKFPHTLRVLQFYLHGLGFELEFLKADGKHAELIGEVQQVSIRLATEEEIRHWAFGKLSKELVREFLIESHKSHFQFLRSRFSQKFQEQLSNVFIARQADPIERILIEAKTFLSLDPVEKEIDKLIENELEATLKKFWSIDEQGILLSDTLAERFKKLKKVKISSDLEKLLAKHSQMVKAIKELNNQETERIKKETGKNPKKTSIKNNAKIKKVLAGYLTDAQQEKLNRLLLEEVFFKKGQFIDEISDLEDSEFFGESLMEQTSWMGCIELAEPIPHPLFAPKEIQKLRYEQSKKIKKDKREGKKENLPKATETDYQTWEKLIKNWAKDNADKMISVLPVIPIALRPSTIDEYQHGLTKLYREVIIANRMLARSTDIDKPKRKFALFKAIDRLFSNNKDNTPSLLKILEGKFGLLRRFLLGKRQDFSGRAVIVPDPTLKLNECGLPMEMLLKWMKPLVINYLIKEDETLSIQDAQETINWALRKDMIAVNKIITSLEKIIAEQELLVLVNRQPSLHRYSLLAFKPKVRTDYVIGFPPMMCNGFNADFDGDTVAVYFPITKDSQLEARKLLPTKHLFSVASGNLMLSLEQDYALGTFLMKKDKKRQKGLTGKFSEIFSETDKTLSEALSSTLNNLPDPKEKVELLKEFQDTVFDAATCGEASFSIFDIGKLVLTEEENEHLFQAKRQEKDDLQKMFDEIPKETGENKQNRINEYREEQDKLSEKFNKSIERAVLKKLKLKENSNNPFARYFLSNAKGNPAQLRQIAASIGYVFDGEGNPLGPIKNSFLQGLCREDYWKLCHSTRRTMIDKKLSVGEAGSLTRDLVEGAYELKITGKDCGTELGITITFPDCDLYGRMSLSGDKQEIIGENTVLDFPADIRSPLTCEAETGICQKCYGLNPATDDFPKEGTLIGIIAGQSIGERGTQLSMRTFHSGGKSMSLKDVKSIFSYGKIDIEDERTGLSVESKWFNKIARDLIVNTYKNAILPVHFEVILKAMKEDDKLIGCQKLAMDWKKRGFLAAASYRELKRILQNVLEQDSVTDDLISPKTWIILGREIQDGKIKTIR